MTNSDYIEILFGKSKVPRKTIQALKQLSDDLDLFPIDAVPQTYLDSSIRVYITQIKEDKINAANAKRVFDNAALRYRRNIAIKRKSKDNYNLFLNDDCQFI